MKTTYKGKALKKQSKAAQKRAKEVLGLLAELRTWAGSQVSQQLLRAEFLLEEALRRCDEQGRR